MKPNPDGEHSSTQALYAEFRRPLLSFFRRRVKDPGEAEDLTQEVFSRLLRERPGDGIADAKGYVFRIALNLLRDRARREGVRGATLLSDVHAGRVASLVAELVEDRHPERVLLAKDEVGRVVRALSALPERTRDMYILFRLENMKQRDIANLYGLSRSTVEKEVMRATLHLALRLERGER
ncbi:RNA polymerase sigma factor [Sphingomonas bacterium]|uniref:RNA polymerase sigma factor n=1 Tax=Sphingomonas bacterium TaxID=1895847 RepID=UPI0015776F81|nr:sigma-70 family RNA polymerase sigma factor [Sphingomonas bacterium]